MGLADTTSHAIWAFVILTVLGGGAVATFQQLESLAEARTEREQAALDAVVVRAEQASFCYGAAATRVNFTATNAGDVPVDLALVDLLVDGVPAEYTTSGQGSIWLPGESRSFYAPGIVVEPARAKLALPHGALTHAEKVTCRVLTTILLTPSSATMDIGTTQDFDVTGRDQFGEIFEATYTWSTTTGSIVALDTDTARLTAGTVAGTWAVTAEAEGVSQSATVVVKPGAPASIDVSPAVTTVPAGGERVFTATVLDAYGNVNATAPVVWTTNAGTITQGGVLTAQTTAQAGRIVTATSGALSDQASVEITPGPVATVTVAPATATLNMNATQQFTATMRDQYGNVNTTASLSWSATSGSITTGGLYTAPSTTGSVTVTATANGQQGTAAVTVQRSVHVDAMATYKNGVAASSFKRGTDTVETRVTIRDHANVLVQGASVTVEYVDPDQVVAATRTATTDASGISSTSYVIPNGAPRNGWTVRVTIITGTGLYYDSAANVVTSVGFTVTN